MIYVAPQAPNRGSKMQNGCFACKIKLRLKELCYNVSLCENSWRQSCKAFIGLTIRAEMIGEGRPLLYENLAHTDPPAFKTPIFYPFLSVAPWP